MTSRDNRPTTPPTLTTMTAAQLAAWRARRGWTQQQAADATGYSVATWQSWELGRRPIRTPVLRALALLDRVV